jgi:hypothetical protein
VHTPVTWILSEDFILVALLPSDYAETTRAAEKIKIEKANPPCPKAGKINREERKTSFCPHRLQPRHQYAIITMRKSAKEGVFNAEQ